MITQKYTLFARKRFPLISEAEIQAIEQRIGIQLPEDYRDFLLSFNGGRFCEPSILPPDPECPTERLDLLKGVNTSDRWAEFASQADMVMFDDNDPPQILPIGSTVSGNLILLVTHPDDRGVILLRTRSRKTFWLADGIEAFFDLLAK